MPPPDTEDLETGYTTGTCACAVTRAGLTSLLNGDSPESVSVNLPEGSTAKIDVEQQTINNSGGTATFSTVKDAGDDPDVTDGAVVKSTVELMNSDGLCLKGGRGVGTVTLPGLPVKPGEPAINPVPRRMMQSMAKRIFERHEYTGGAIITIDVEDGQQLAQKTLNPRLGIEDGLSILGTTGIVHPYSNASYVASIEQGIDVANRNGYDELVLSTGGRTEQTAMNQVDLPKLAFVQFAGFLEEALDHLYEHTFRMLHFYFMPGKFAKFAQGHLKLHSKESEVDLERVRSDIDDITGDKSIKNRINGLKSVNQTLSKLDSQPQKILIQKWLERIPNYLNHHYPDPPWNTLRVVILNLDGEILGEKRWTPGG